VSIDGSFDLPPEEALKYFRQKGLTKGFDYRDVEREEHAAGFTVAKMMDLDLLSDTRAAVDDALAKGQTFGEFKAGLEPMLQQRGWWGIQQVHDDQTGEDVFAELGSPRRLRTIFDTNLSTAYAAGSWSQIEDNAEEAPYLMYDAILDDRTRPEHRAWDGTVLRYDDPWWGDHTPPCGYNCRCSVIQLSGEEVKRQGKVTDLPAPPSPKRTVVNARTGEVSQVPVGVDPGFDYNPGQLSRSVRTAQAFATKIAGADADLGAEAFHAQVKRFLPSLQTYFSAWVRTARQAGEPQRKWQIAGVMHPDDLAFLKRKGVEPVTAEIAVEDRLIIGPKQARHEKAGNELGFADWQNLPQGLADPQAVLYDKVNDNLLYVWQPVSGDGNSKVVVEPEFQLKRPKRTLNAIRSGFRVNTATLADANRYEVVRGALE
jgi:SPP1 gp7 family putative phage head morphogenesis protein